MDTAYMQLLYVYYTPCPLEAVRYSLTMSLHMHTPPLGSHVPMPRTECRVQPFSAVGAGRDGTGRRVGARAAPSSLAGLPRPTARSMADCRYCRAIKDVFLVSAEMAGPTYRSPDPLHVTGGPRGRPTFVSADGRQIVDEGRTRGVEPSRPVSRWACKTSAAVL